MRPRFVKSFAQKIRGRRECRVLAAPAVSCAKVCKGTHTSIQVQTEHSGIPCAMALRLMPRSPRRRIRLVTVADGLKDCLNPVGSTRLRQLDTSNGCQDHTVLPYAASPVVCTLCLLTDQSPPCEHDHAPDAAASTASRPNVRDDGQRPSSGTGWRRYRSDLGQARTGIFSHTGLDR
jgi:hypothetical protein